MIKIIVVIVVCFFTLFLSQSTFAEEQLPLPVGKNVKEWEAISGALMKDQRYEEAVIYLDKIIEKEPNNLRALTNKGGVLIHLEKFEASLEISNRVLESEPNRISALQNKGVAYKYLEQHEEAFLIFNRILEIDPGNEQAANSIFRVLGLMPTISTVNSPYQIHVQLIVRDEDGNLLGVLESYNARYLPSKFFEQWWDRVNEMGMVTEHEGKHLLRVTEITTPEDDHTGKFHWETGVLEREDMPVTIFEVFVPMMQIDMNSEIVEVQLTVVKD